MRLLAKGKKSQKNEIGAVGNARALGLGKFGATEKNIGCVAARLAGKRKGLC